MTSKQFYENAYAQIGNSVLHWRETGGTIKARNVVEIVGALPVRTVLDIGSGTGAVLANLAKLGFGEQYWAVDIAEQAISLVRQRQDIPGLAEARTFDGSHLPYQDGQFDLAILSHVVEHLEDPQPLVREAARVARYLAIEVPLEDNLYTHLKVDWFGSRYREEIGHIQWFNWSAFRSVLEQHCGLDVIRMQMVYLPDEMYYLRKRGVALGLTFAFLGIRKALRMLPDRLYTRLLTDHCIALARRSRSSTR
jgi:SAM-dependent methyltransferase